MNFVIISGYEVQGRYSKECITVNSKLNPKLPILDKVLDTVRNGLISAISVTGSIGRTSDLLIEVTYVCTRL